MNETYTRLRLKIQILTNNTIEVAYKIHTQGTLFEYRATTQYTLRDQNYPGSTFLWVLLLPSAVSVSPDLLRSPFCGVLAPPFRPLSFGRLHMPASMQPKTSLSKGGVFRGLDSSMYVCKVGGVGGRVGGVCRRSSAHRATYLVATIQNRR